MEQSNNLFQRSEKLLDFFCKFHEDFDALRGVFAANPNSERRHSFNKISGQDDIKLAILRDDILRLVESFENNQVGHSEAELEAKRLALGDFTIRLESIIEQTTKVRKRCEGHSGYSYTIETPRYNVIGNNARSTHSRDPPTRPGTSWLSAVNQSTSKTTANTASRDTRDPTKTSGPSKPPMSKQPRLSVKDSDKKVALETALQAQQDLNAMLTEKLNAMEKGIEDMKYDRDGLENELYEVQQAYEELEKKFKLYDEELTRRNGGVPVVPQAPHVLKAMAASNARIRRKYPGLSHAPTSEVVPASSPTDIQSSPPINPSKLLAPQGSSKIFPDARQKARQKLVEEASKSASENDRGSTYSEDIEMDDIEKEAENDLEDLEEENLPVRKHLRSRSSQKDDNQKRRSMSIYSDYGEDAEHDAKTQKILEATKKGSQWQNSQSSPLRTKNGSKHRKSRKPTPRYD